MLTGLLGVYIIAIQRKGSVAGWLYRSILRRIINYMVLGTLVTTPRRVPALMPAMPGQAGTSLLFAWR